MRWSENPTGLIPVQDQVVVDIVSPAVVCVVHDRAGPVRGWWFCRPAQLRLVVAVVVVPGFPASSI